MRYQAIALVLVSLALTSGQPGEAQQPQKPKVHPEVWRKARENGVVNVIVRLNISVDSKYALSASDAARIRDAQRRLLAELSGTKHKVTKRVDSSLLIALDDVDSDALEVLENSSLVLRVTENLRLQTTLSSQNGFLRSCLIACGSVEPGMED